MHKFFAAHRTDSIAVIYLIREIVPSVGNVGNKPVACIFIEVLFFGKDYLINPVFDSVYFIQIFVQ